METDLDAIQKVRLGDPAGAEALFTRHADAILRFATRMLGIPSDAEEICQDVFLKMIDRADQYDGRAPLGSWLLSIAANACRDRLRSRKVRIAAPLTAANEQPAPGLSPVASLIAREDARRLERALATLTDEQREVLVLARDHELPYAEIARLCGTTEGAVKTRIFRALESLRRTMNDDAPAPRARRTPTDTLATKETTWTTAKR